MKTYFKTFAIITLSLLLTNCRKAPNSSRLQKSYEEAVKLHQAGNLNDTVFHYQSTALQCQYYPKDSLTYWWKAMCGQGEIWKEKNFLDYAQSDFEAVQQFAVRHRLGRIHRMPKADPHSLGTTRLQQSQSLCTSRPPNLN